jgi:hypothetical protein
LRSIKTGPRGSLGTIIESVSRRMAELV